MRRSINKNHGAANYDAPSYEIIGTTRVNGNKIRVERWADGSIHAWDATNGREATADEFDEAMENIA